jgi:hypothetical protein
MLLGELNADFQFGVLLITDRDSSEEIPPWGSTDEQVTAAESAAVVRVRHADEGAAVVRIWDDDSEVVGAVAFEGRLRTPTGQVTVSDALGNSAVTVEIGHEVCNVRVFVNSSVEADHIDLVVEAFGDER